MVIIIARSCAPGKRGKLAQRASGGGVDYDETHLDYPADGGRRGARHDGIVANIVRVRA